MDAEFLLHRGILFHLLTAGFPSPLLPCIGSLMDVLPFRGAIVGMRAGVLTLHSPSCPVGPLSLSLATLLPLPLVGLPLPWFPLLSLSVHSPLVGILECNRTHPSGAALEKQLLEQADLETAEGLEKRSAPSWGMR